MRLRSTVLLIALAACRPTPDAAAPTDSSAEVPPADGPPTALSDVLRLRAWPETADERNPSVMADLGSWFGVALRSDASPEVGFAGPWMVDEGRWLGRSMLGLTLVDPGGVVPQVGGQSWSEPGALRLTWGAAPELQVRATLRFVAPDVAMVRATVHNTGGSPTPVGLRWQGETLGRPPAVDTGRITVAREGEPTVQLLAAGAAAGPGDTSHSYRLDLPVEPLAPGSTRTEVLFLVRGEAAVPRDPDGAWQASATRWQRYLAGARAQGADRLPRPEDQRLAAKATMTLLSNWRRAEAGLRHDGLFPSYAYPGFHGVWSWDSWKHAVALAHIDPKLAQEQIRVLFAEQRGDGMVPDVIYRNPKNNNWRDTKPPLSAWAVWAVHQAQPDPQFLAEMRPKLEAYHAWWYRDRDHDRNGLCEFGSTDGTLRAAAWESGMDNAVRFDGAKMVENHTGAHSMDRESVDLNAYLVAEKRHLAQIAGALGDAAAAAKHRADADALAERVVSVFWSEATGWFHDRRLDGTLVEVKGPEGFTPLWTGVATPAQAARIRETILDPEHFATHAPFPTLDAARPEFEPGRGYWRGPVWLDQAYFATAGLRRYGFEEDANALTERLFQNLEGLRDTAPIRETYNPRTGAGQNAHHFSWSAAHILMLLWDRAPAPSDRPGQG